MKPIVKILFFILLTASVSAFSIAELEEALIKDPLNLDAALRLSEKYIEKKDYGKALERINFILGVDSKNYSAYYLRAEIYKAQNKINSAISDYLECISLKPAEPLPHLHLGYLYFNLKRIDLALEEFELALKNASSPDQKFLARWYLFRINQLTQNNALALSHLKNALDNFQYKESYVEPAVDFLIENDIESADFLTSRNLEKNKTVFSYVIRAKVLYKLGKEDVALNLLKEAQKLNLTTADRITIASFYESASQPVSALQEYEKIWFITHDASALKEAARLSYNLKNYEKASDYYKVLLSYYEEKDIRLSYARALYSLNNFKSSIEILNGITDADYEKSFYLGRNYEKLNNLDRSYSAYNNAYKIKETKEVLEALIRISEKRKDYESAALFLEKYVKYDSSNQIIEKLNFARLKTAEKYASKDINKALSHLKQITTESVYDDDKNRLLSRIYFNNENFNEALKYLEEIKTKKASDYEIGFFIWDSRDDGENKLLWSDNYFNSGGRDENIVFYAARGFFDRGQFSKSLTILEKSGILSEKFYVLMSDNLFKLNRSEENLKLLLKAAAAFPYSTELNTQLIEQAFLFKKYELTLKTARDVINTNPGYISYKYAGLSEFHLGNYENALKFFLSAMNLDKDKQITEYTAKTYFNLKNYRQSLAFLEELKELSKETLYIKAVSLFETEKYFDSVKIFEELGGNEDYLTECYFKIADYYYVNKNYPQAAEYFQKGFELKKDSQIAFFIGMSFYEMKDIKKAKEYFLKGVEISPVYADNYIYLAELSEDSQEKINYYLRVPVLSSKDYYNVGYNYFKLNRYKEAAQYLKNALAEGVADYDLYFYLCKSLYNLNDNEALIYAEKALAYKQTDDILNIAAEIYFKNKDYGNSIEKFLLIENLTPPNIKKIALSYFETENYEKAVEYFEMHDGDMPEEYLKSCEILAGKNDKLNKEEAEKYYLKAINRKFNEIQNRVNLALFYEKNSRYQKAVEILNGVNNFSANLIKAYAYFNMGDMSKSLSFFQKVPREHIKNKYARAYGILKKDDDKIAAIEFLNNAEEHLNLSELYELAKLYRQTKQYPQAKSIALENYKNFSPFIYLYIEILEEEKNFVQASNFINQVIKQYDSDSKLFFLAAKINIKTGETKKAQENLLKSIEYNYPGLEPYFELAKINFDIKNYTKAVEYAERCKIFDPEFKGAYELLIDIYSSTDNRAMALAEYEALLDKFKEKQYFEDYENFIIRILPRLPQAEKNSVLMRAYSLYPSSLSFLRELIILSFDKKDFYKASVFADIYEKFGGTNEYLKEIKAVSLINQDKYLAAIEYLKNQIRQIPQFKFKSLLAFSYLKLNNSRQAETLINEIKGYADDMYFHYTAGELNFEKDNYDSALEHYLKVFGRQENFQDIRLKIGISAYKTNKFQLANFHLSAAENKNADKYMGLSFYRMEDYSKAVEILINLDLQLVDAEVLNAAVFCYRQLGLIQQAEAYVEKISNLNIEGLSEILKQIKFEVALKDDLPDIEKLTEAHTLSPNDLKIIKTLADAYLDLKNYSKAAEFLRKYESIKKDHYVYSNLGNAYYELGNITQAIPYYISAIEMKNNDYTSIHKLAVCYDRIKDFELALVYYEKAKNYVYDYGIFKRIALISLHTGDLTRSLENFLKCVEFKKEQDVLDHIAGIYLKQGENRLALSYFTESHQLSPRFNTALNIAKIQKTFLNASNVINILKDYEEEQSAEIYKLLGWAYYYLKNYEASETYYKQALKLDIDDTLIHYELAKTLQAQNKLDEALSHLTKVRERLEDSDVEDVYLTLARTYYNENSLNRAQGLFEEFIAKEQYIEESYYYLAKINFKKENYRAALAHLSKVTKDILNDDIIHEFKADIYLKLNETQNAVEELKKALLIKPSDGIYYKLALLYKETNPDEGYSYLEQIENQGDNVKLLFAETLFELKRYNESLDYLNGINEDYENYQKVFFTRGKIYQIQNLLKEAAGEYLKSYELAATRENLMRLASINMLLRDYVKSLEYINELLEQEPDNADALLIKARVFILKEDYEEAKAILARLIKIRPYYTEAHYYLGTVLYNLNEYEEALGYFDKALTNNIQTSNSLSYTGLIYEKLNRFDEAVDVYKKIIALDIQSELVYRAYFKIGEVYFKREEYTEAVENFKKALSINADDYMSYYYLSLCEYNLNNLTEALDLIKKSHQLNPNINTYKLYSKILYELENYKDAEEILQKALSAYAAAPELTHIYVDVLVKNRNFNRAKIEIEELLNASQASPEQIYILAEIYSSQRQYENAAKFLEQAIEAGLKKDFDVLFKLGGYYENLNDKEKALKNYKEAKTFSPQNYFLRYKTALLEFDLGNPDYSLKELDYIALQEIDFKEEFNKSYINIFYKTGNYLKVAEYFDKITARDINLIFTASLSNYKLNDYEKAYSLIENVSFDINNLEKKYAEFYFDLNAKLKQADNILAAAQNYKKLYENPSITVNYGYALYLNGKYKEGAEVLTRIVNTTEMPSANYYLLKIYEKTGNKNLAGFLKDSLAKFPSDVSILKFAADYYFTQKNYEESFKAYNKLSAFFPEDFNIALKSAQTALLLNRRQTAVNIYEKTLQWCPAGQKDIIYRQLAEIYNELGYYTKTLSYLETISSRTYADKFNVAYNRYLSGDLTSAENNLKNLLEEKKDANVYNLLGVIYLSKQNYNQALFYVTRALEEEKDNYDFLLNAGYINIKLNKFSEAEIFYTRAAKINGDNPKAYLNLADMYFLNSKYNEAKAVYQLITQRFSNVARAVNEAEFKLKQIELFNP